MNPENRTPPRTVNYARAVIVIGSLFLLAVGCIGAGGQFRAIALPAVLGAAIFPLLAHCRCCQDVIRLASCRYPERWRVITSETGVRYFLFDRDDLGDPEIAKLKRALRRWGYIFGATLIAALLFVAIAAGGFGSLH